MKKSKMNGRNRGVKSEKGSLALPWVRRPPDVGQDFRIAEKLAVTNLDNRTRHLFLFFINLEKLVLR